MIISISGWRELTVETFEAIKEGLEGILSSEGFELFDVEFREDNLAKLYFGKSDRSGQLGMSIPLDEEELNHVNSIRFPLNSMAFIGNGEM